MSKSAVVLILCVILVATAFTGCLDWGEKKEKKAENQPPTAYAGNDKTVNVGDSVQFNGIGSDPDGSIVLYEWNFGDGATSTAQNPTHQYTNAGTYMVMLTVTDDDGAADTDAVSISVVEVSNLPPAAVTLYNPSDITADSMLLSWSKSIDDDFSNYTIYQSASSGDIGTGIHTITAQSTTSYTVTGLQSSITHYFTIRVYDTGGLHNDSSQVGGTTLSAAENHAPVPAISSPLNNDVFLTTDNIFFDGLNSSDPDNDTLTFYWASNISGYLSTQSQFYTTLAMGCHLITLSVNDSVVNASATVNITVNEPVENQHPAAVLLYEPTDITENSVALSWSQNMDEDFDRYEIYQSTVSGNIGMSVHTITAQSTTSYTVTELTSSTTYYFTIRVYDTGGLDNDSNQVNSTTLSSGGEGITVDFIDSTYEIASGGTSGWFHSGQDADIMLSGIDFNNTGGALLFNHPMGIASDGERLLLADTRNNRILIWNSLPTENSEPDIVLGQKDFYSNIPGTGLNQMNWPVSVATDGEHVVVADTYNDRVLIWNNFPTQNGTLADIELKAGIEWPWAVWTNGEKLVVTRTMGSRVLIWNTFPTTDNPPDLILRGKNPDDGTDRFGTPRTIGTDGETYLVIGDHNAIGHTEAAPSGSFFWNSFPTSDNEAYDFFMANPEDPGQMMWGGVNTSDGKFIMVASPGIAIWNSVPTSVVDPDLFVGRAGGPSDETGYCFNDGDGSDLAITPSGKLFISLYNSNKVVAFNSVPTSSIQCPDFAIGAPDIDTNTLDTNYFITNPVPVSDGESLFVSSDFDCKLYVWKHLPDESGAKPDIVYSLPFAPWDSVLFENTYVLAGRETVCIWETLPRNGELPDLWFKGSIDNVTFQDLRGVALDSKYFYLADRSANKIYVWEGIPDNDTNPKFSIDIEGPTRLSSDGTYLVAAATEAAFDERIKFYKIDEISSSAEGTLLTGINVNLPQAALAVDGHLFIGDTGFNRVLVWWNISDAVAGSHPEIVLGEEDFEDTSPEIGIDKLFWPAGMSFDGDYLWVGEFKFSGRVLRFSPTPSAGNQQPTAYIDSITPNPADQGQTVSFVGHGVDGTITAYNWRSSMDGQLSSSASFATSNLSVGTHTVYFKVKDSNETWSSEISTALVINPSGENQPAAVTLYNPVVNMTETGIDKITLSWSQNTESDFDRYEVHMSEVSGFTPSPTTIVANITSSSVPNMTAASYTSWKITMDFQPDIIYYFKIRVYNKNGLCNDSNEMDTTMPQMSYIKENWDSSFEGVSPEIIYYNEQYYLFYSSDQGMVYRTSLDGISNWSAATSLGIGGGDPCVIVCENNSLRLLYKGAETAPGVRVLQSAFSTDGAVWTEEGNNLLPGVEVPTVVQVSGTQYRIYYCNPLVTPYDGIYSAVSNDEGKTWTEEGLCFTDNNRDPAPVDPDVIKLSDESYIMYYIANIGLVDTGKGDEKMQIHSQIYSAMSSDGRNFTPMGLVIDYSGADNSFCLLDPSAIVLTSDTTRVYYGYQAEGENTWDIGSAITLSETGPGGVPPLFSGDVNSNLSALFDEYNNSVPKDVLITWLNDTGNQMLEGMVGPSQHKLYTAYSLDGINVNGTEQPDGYIIEDRTFILPNASVPDAVVSPDNTTIRLYFVDAHPTRKIINALTLISGENVTADDLWFLYNEYYIGGTNIFNTAKSTDGENFTFECMRISGLSEDYMVADPSVVVLENGSYRIYFLYVAKTELPDGQGDPAAAKNQSIACAYSSHGANFTFERVCYSGVYGECMSDPEVFKTGEYYRLYLHPDAGIRPFRYVNSTDGGRTFTGDVVWIQIEHMWDVAGCGCRIIDTGDGYRIYFGYNGTTASAFSSDGVNWVFDEMPKVGGRGYMAAVRFKGMYFLYFHA